MLIIHLEIIPRRTKDLVFVNGFLISDIIRPKKQTIQVCPSTLYDLSQSFLQFTFFYSKF